ncbi:MAG: DUF1818 family protein [Nodosilinea sp.]
MPWQPPTLDQRFLKEGNGWRLGWDAAAPHYKGLLAGADWAIELTELEFQEFCRLAPQLVQSLQTVAPELMDEERITCEAESELIWLELEGFPTAYSLRLIIHTGRRCEGGWNSEAAPQVIQAIAQLKLV